MLRWRLACAYVLKNRFVYLKYIIHDIQMTGITYKKRRYWWQITSLEICILYQYSKSSNWRKRMCRDHWRKFMFSCIILVKNWIGKEFIHDFLAPIICSIMVIKLLKLHVGILSINRKMSHNKQEFSFNMLYIWFLVLIGTLQI